MSREIEIKKLQQKGNKVQLLFKGVDVTIMNGLRRSVMGHVPTPAIEDITIFENDSPLSDEYIAQRLGLLPIQTTKEVQVGDEFMFTLEKEGPGTVYSKDIESKDPKTKISGNRIPLTELDKKQRIKIEMKAIVGTGSENSKWQPAIIAYKQVPKITIDEACEFGKKIVDSCPVNVLEQKGKKVVLVDAAGCTLCGACRDTCSDGHVVIEYQPDQFVLEMESHGTENEQILLKAVEVLQEKAQSFKKALKSKE